MQQKHDTSDLEIDVLSCIDSPQQGVTSWGTIGMSDWTNLAASGGTPEVRVELVAACQSSVDFGSFLASCAFNVGTGQFGIAPNLVFPRVIELYRPDVTMAHLMFVPPFLWNSDFPTVREGSIAITWLQAVPVSESEFLFLKSNGAEALTELFEGNQIDVFDIDRRPVA